MSTVVEFPTAPPPPRRQTDEQLVAWAILSRAAWYAALEQGCATPFGPWLEENASYVAALRRALARSHAEWEAGRRK
jgi:hypothetical protein